MSRTQFRTMALTAYLVYVTALILGVMMMAVPPMRSSATAGIILMVAGGWMAAFVYVTHVTIRGP